MTQYTSRRLTCGAYLPITVVVSFLMFCLRFTWQDSLGLQNSSSTFKQVHPRHDSVRQLGCLAPSLFADSLLRDQTQVAAETASSVNLANLCLQMLTFFQDH